MTYKNRTPQAAAAKNNMGACLHQSGEKRKAVVALREAHELMARDQILFNFLDILFILFEA